MPTLFNEDLHLVFDMEVLKNCTNLSNDGLGMLLNKCDKFNSIYNFFLVNSKESEELKFSPTTVEPAQYKAEIAQLQIENAALRNEVLSLTSEVYGAKLAAKYLDKELAGRIQQLQLLGKPLLCFFFFINTLNTPK